MFAGVAAPETATTADPDPVAAMASLRLPEAALLAADAAAAAVSCAAVKPEAAAVVERVAESACLALVTSTGVFPGAAVDAVVGAVVDVVVDVVSDLTVGPVGM